jgi:hypothetical protein
MRLGNIDEIATLPLDNLRIISGSNLSCDFDLLRKGVLWKLLATLFKK